MRWIEYGVMKRGLLGCALCAVAIINLTASHALAIHSTARILSKAPISPKAARRQAANVETLEQGSPIKRSIEGDAAHIYRVSLTAGQYLRAILDKQGADVVATLLGPDGRRIILAAAPNGTRGTEPISLVAEESGEYRIEVRPFDKKAPVGDYEIRIEALRPATQPDRDQAAAEKLYWDAEELRSQRSAESDRKALEKYNLAIPIFRALNDQTFEYYSSSMAAFIYHSSGELERALEYYNQALALCRTLNNRSHEAALLNNIGGVYEVLGEPYKALEHYGEALTIWPTVENRRAHGDTLNNVGVIYYNMGQPQKALDYYLQALMLKREVGDPSRIATTLANIANVYATLGEQEQALEYHQQAIEMRRAAKDIRGEARSLHAIGDTYALFGETAKALEYYNQALPLHRAVGNRQGEALTLDNIGAALNSLGKRDEALEHHQQALNIQRAIKDRRSEAITLYHIGNVHTLSGNLQKAADYYNEALSLARAVKDLRLEANILQSMARVERDRDDFLTARKHIEEALSKIEAVRSSVDIQLRASYLGIKLDAYQFYIALLMRMHRLNPSERNDVAALKASEQARARSFLEMLAEARINIRQGVAPALIERERMLSQQINVKAERLTQALGQQNLKERAASLTKQLAELQNEYQQTQAAIRKASPAYAALTQPQPLAFKEIQQLLDSDTLLLEYALGDERSYLWAVTPDSLTTYELPDRAEIESLARRVYQSLTAPNQTIKGETYQQRDARILKAEADYKKAAAELSRMLLDPAAAELSNKRLLIVADGALQYIPFAALPAPQGSAVGSQASGTDKTSGDYESAQGLRQTATGNRSRGLTADSRPLISDHEIVNLPSASALAVLRRKVAERAPAPKAVAVIADPVFSRDDPRFKSSTTRRQTLGAISGRAEDPMRDFERAIRDVRVTRDGADIARLPFSRREADAIEAMVPAQHMMKAVDFDASRATATSAALSQYRIIHFATHGLLNNEHPELSGIVLSLVDKQGRAQDGFLRLHEIYNLNLPAELVVLSACQTGLGKEIKGEGLVGLTRGFMYAGAARVMASLWKVDDAATAELLKRFYAKMLGGGLRPPAALREAQIEMLKQKRWQLPYYWAAFTLQGEWR